MTNLTVIKKIYDKSPTKKRQSAFQEDNFSYGVGESEYEPDFPNNETEKTQFEKKIGC